MADDNYPWHHTDADPWASRGEAGWLDAEPDQDTTPVYRPSGWVWLIVLVMALGALGMWRMLRYVF